MSTNFFFIRKHGKKCFSIKRRSIGIDWLRRKSLKSQNVVKIQLKESVVGNIVSTYLIFTMSFTTQIYLFMTQTTAVIAKVSQNLSYSKRIKLILFCQLVKYFVRFLETVTHDRLQSQQFYWKILIRLVVLIFNTKETLTTICFFAPCISKKSQQNQSLVHFILV